MSWSFYIIAMLTKVKLFGTVVLLSGLALGSSVSVALAVTPTPTPTATATPFVNSPVVSFHVDNNEPLPWPLPIVPTFPPLTPSPTLYNATPIHSTDYPNQVATATAQIAVFTGPIDAIATPVAQMIGVGPTPDGSELNTGEDVGTGTISFVSWASDLGEDVGPIMGVGLAFINGILSFLSYAPVLAPPIVAMLAAFVISAFITLIILIIKAGQWLADTLNKLFTMIGTWFPG